jgi:uncharacterized protein YaaR (DUF327 family)
MLALYKSAVATLTVKSEAVEAVKARGNYTWKRPQPVAVGEFADLIENYIGDCLEDGFNLKSSKTMRDEKRDAAKAAKVNANA